MTKQRHGGWGRKPKASMKLRDELDAVRIFNLSNPSSSDIIPPTTIYLKNTINWEQSLQMSKTMGEISHLNYHNSKVPQSLVK